MRGRPPETGAPLLLLRWCPVFGFVPKCPAEFVAQPFEGGAEGGDERGGGIFHLGADLGIAHGGSDRVGNRASGVAQGSQRLSQVVLGGTAVPHEVPVASPEAVAHIGPSLARLGPRIGGRRIVLVILHLLDGTYELFRAHFGVPPRTAPDGMQVGATRGVMDSTIALLDDPAVTHLGVSFDTVVESFRNAMFDGYKTGEGIEPDLWAQFPLVERAMRALGVVTWSMVEFEADDGIATAAARWRDEVEQVVILSPDKDLMQCVRDDRVVTFNRRERKRFTRLDVIEKFGVPPESIPDYLALVGDAADGVPGLPGWGAKSASTLLARYGHLEDIPASAEEWDVTVRGPGRLAATLDDRREEALLYRSLTTLRTDVPLEETLDDLRWRGVVEPDFTELCVELGFESLFERGLPARQ